MQLVRPEAESRSMLLGFEVVPVYDLLFSLAAAANPEKYEMPGTWARGVRAALPQPLRRDVGYFFGDPAALGTGAVQCVPDVSDGDIAAVVEHLQSLEPAEFVTVLLWRTSADRALRGAIRRSARRRGNEEDERLVRDYVSTQKAQTRTRFMEILADPAGMQSRYITLLRAHHEGWFTEHYSEVQPYLEQRARQGRRSIGKLPAKEVIARATGGFTLRTPAARSVQLTPSYYAAPFVVVVRDGRDVVLVYGARPRQEASHRAIDGGTVRVLKALADETRLSILQLLAQRPLYGQQIAEALGLSHPTISHHMTQLRIAGLTQTELTEDGNKAYSVRPEAVQALCDGLRAAFVEPADAGAQR